MHTAHGSISDRLHDVAGILKRCDSLAALECRASGVLRTLDDQAVRIVQCRRHGAVPIGVAPALSWLAQVVADHPVLALPEGEPIRGELLALIDRLRHQTSSALADLPRHRR
jgi:hypothetical protein